MPQLGGGIDLSRVCVVTPGRRLGRLLQRRIAELAAKESRWFSPPRFLTPVQIPDALLGLPTREVATPTQRMLAWKQSLENAERVDAERIVGPRAVLNEGNAFTLDDGRWLDDTVSRLARGLVLPREVPSRCSAVLVRGEHERWESLDRLREQYEALLERAGLCDQRLDQLRLLRDVESGSPFELPEDAPAAVVLVGVLELDRAARKAIELFRDAKHAATPRSADHASVPERVMIIAAGDRHGLDELGTISPDRSPQDLTHSHIPLEDDSLFWTADPSRAAALALDSIAEWNDKGEAPAADCVTICSPDESFTQELAIQAAAVRGVSIHDAAGTPLAATGVGRLVHALAAYLRSPDRLTLATLCKQAAAARALSNVCGSELPGDWAVQLDEAAAISPRAEVAGDPGICGIVHARVNSLLSAGNSQSQSLIDHAVQLGNMLGALLHGSEDRDLFDALAASIRELGQCASLSGTISLSQAADLLLEVMKGATLAPEPRTDAVEVLGWLDAAYDPAPKLILLGFNAGLLPGRPSPNAWLNETVMKALGMFTSEHAAARDAYLLRHALEVRKSSGEVRAVIARADSEGATLWPSPLVFACDDETAMRRARVGSDSTPSVRVKRLQSSPSMRPDAFPVAPLVEREPPKAVNVTAFREFRESPYLFFLRHVARVEEAIDPGRESDYRDLGTLTHNVLRDFASGSESSSQSADRIFAWLKDRADETMRMWPSHLITSTRGMQQTALMRRLRRFAELQAEHRSEGWSIAHSEWQTPREITLETPVGRLGLKGRIDRVDRRGDELMVIDYKVSDALKNARDALKPGKDGANGDWRDLQLPLYRHLLRESGEAASRWRLVYWSLCAEKHGPKLVDLNVSDSDFQAAHELAVELAAKMIQREFRGLGDPRDRGGSISRLCGLRLLDSTDGESDS